jgi:uncharacterized protein YkwD
MSLPAARAICSARRRRLVVLLTALAVALAGLFTPTVTTSAHASVHRLSVAQTREFGYLMLHSLNVERAWNHLPALRMNNQLVISATRHDYRMAVYNEMSHQLPGEPFFATRIANAGYHWRMAGENIGVTDDMTMHGLYVLEHEMYVEKAPNNGHRVNILSRSFRDVGIRIWYDTHHHKIWFTQDFGLAG